MRLLGAEPWHREADCNYIHVLLRPTTGTSRPLHSDGPTAVQEGEHARAPRAGGEQDGHGGGSQERSEGDTLRKHRSNQTALGLLADESCCLVQVAPPEIEAGTPAADTLQRTLSGDGSRYAPTRCLDLPMRLR